MAISSSIPKCPPSTRPSQSRSLFPPSPTPSSPMHERHLSHKCTPSRRCWQHPYNDVLIVTQNAQGPALSSRIPFVFPMYRPESHQRDRNDAMLGHCRVSSANMDRERNWLNPALRIIRVKSRVPAYAMCIYITCRARLNMQDAHRAL
jgi:hypothetical protein